MKGAGREQLWRETVDACVNGIITISAAAPAYVIEYANPAFERLTGHRGAELAGHSSALLWGSGQLQEGAREFLGLLDARREGRVLLRTRHKDGTLLWSDAYVAPVRAADGEVGRFVISYYDVTEKKRYAEQLEYQASHDALTGLVNRSLLRDRLAQAIAAAQRRRYLVWVVLIDLDHFRSVNGSFGHHTGDRLLKNCAERLTAAVRASDTVARLDGDEFVLVLAEDADGVPNQATLERIVGALGQPASIDGQPFMLTCSIGVASYPQHGADPDLLIAYADQAMHLAKERGRNNFQFFQPEMDRRVQERQQQGRALRLALERAEFCLRYQPEVDLRSGRVAGIEALLCWQHPERGILPYERFAVLAEESGLMPAIGAWALRAACAQAVQWQQDGLGQPRIALKLGPGQFHAPELAAGVAAVLEETGLAPACLELELAESLLMSDLGRTLAVLHALRKLGVTLAIHGFGNGYSSLTSLKRFPIDVLKIDQSLVREIAPLANEAAIADAIISMAHSLGIRVVAEGVDHEAQCEFLSRNMCDEIQGTLFAAPLAAPAMGELLREGRSLPARLLRLHQRERTLLLVDDEPNILAALKRQMRGAGLRILTAPSGQAGLALLATEPVDVIVSDQRMPGMTGVEFLRIVKNTHPETVRMVLSGFTELQSVTDAVNEGAIYKFLTKPWDDTQLRAHIEEAFALKGLADENRRLDLELRAANSGLARANRQLSEVLQQQQEQIQRDGIALEIVRELLQYVPEPIIGVDDDEVVAFANLAAQALFRQHGSLLGNPAAHFMPDLQRVLRGAGDGQPCTGQLDGKTVELRAHRMGKGTASRGKLIVFAARATSIQNDEEKT